MIETNNEITINVNNIGTVQMSWDIYISCVYYRLLKYINDNNNYKYY